MSATEEVRFQFNAPSEPGQAKSLEEYVFEALGAASMCWEDPGGAGVFDSTRAKAIGDELVKAILWAQYLYVRSVLGAALGAVYQPELPNVALRAID